MLKNVVNTIFYDLKGEIMILAQLRNKLISFGYHPDEVEYSLLELLQYKKREHIGQQDLKILLSMLQERIEVERAYKYRQKKRQTDIVK